MQNCVTCYKKKNNNKSTHKKKSKIYTNIIIFILIIYINLVYNSNIYFNIQIKMSYLKRRYNNILI